MNYEINEADRLEYKIKTLEFKIERLGLQTAERVVLGTASGKIQGVQRRSVYDDVYYSFERIPYAQPPLGELRFRAPKPLGPWSGVRDCTQYGAKPMQQQLGDGRAVGSEDCLYLNVYTNNLKPSKPRPVMVWIYGGGFTFGEATPEWFGPDYFMRTDVVLVTVQYRVGALGFLSMNDPRLHSPGNAGIKDQILALKWLKRNCGAFGGNPSAVTVFGESAGSRATHLLMLSDQAKGLFQAAIMQSGAMNLDGTSFHCAQHSYTLATMAGYAGDNKDADVLKYLLSCSATQIVEAEAKCYKRQGGERVTFGYCIEPFVTPHTVLQRHPSELLEQAWGNAIPLMIGNTSNEGVMFAPIARQFPHVVLKELETCTAYVPARAVVSRDSPEAREKGQTLRRLHLKGETPTVADYYELVSFAWFWHPLQNAVDARLQLRRKAGATYLYRYDFESTKLINPYYYMREGRSVRGVAHTDDLSALFHNAVVERFERDTREYRTIERMIDLWTIFAATGNPNTAKMNSTKGFKWQPLKDVSSSSAVWKCLNIADDLTYIDLPEMAKLKVWNELYDLQHRPPKNTAASAYAKSQL